MKNRYTNINYIALPKTIYPESAISFSMKQQLVFAYLCIVIFILVTVSSFNVISDINDNSSLTLSYQSRTEGTWHKIAIGLGGDSMRGIAVADGNNTNTNLFSALKIFQFFNKYKNNGIIP